MTRPLTLGTIEASEILIRELYIDLKQRVHKWASLTHQTAQARMGYVGQHLVSVVTGYPGGRSGARGKDLVLPGGHFAEIKTCYRVDQLGKCNDCGAAVASVEEVCPSCSSSSIERKDDSKWLIGVRHEEEFAHILDPVAYYLVLFDFTDLADPTTIRASIWRVDTHTPGFAFCLVDYYHNIRTASKSKAPLNLWPYQLKFCLMKPMLVYRSLINVDDTIATEVFPGRDDEVLYELEPLQNYSQSQNLTIEKCKHLARMLGLSVGTPASKKATLQAIQEHVVNKRIPKERLADITAFVLYWPDISRAVGSLPNPLGAEVRKIAKSIA